MFFFPPNCPPDLLEKLTLHKNDELNKSKKLEIRKADEKKLSELEDTLSNFHENINNTFSMSRMMYYSQILKQHTALNKKLESQSNYYH